MNMIWNWIVLIIIRYSFNGYTLIRPWTQHASPVVSKRQLHSFIPCDIDSTVQRNVGIVLATSSEHCQGFVRVFVKAFVELTT